MDIQRKEILHDGLKWMLLMIAAILAFLAFTQSLSFGANVRQRLAPSLQQIVTGVSVSPDGEASVAPLLSQGEQFATGVGISPDGKPSSSTIAGQQVADLPAPDPDGRPFSAPHA